MELKKSKGGLGKGLGSFGLSGSFKDGHKSGYEMDITKIQPNPNQPRKRFTEEDMETLVASIQAHGLIAPIAVRKVDDHYEIVAGERRWRACQQAGLTKIPVVVRDYTTEEVSEIALVENLQRQNLNPIEEAFGYQYLMDTFKKTQEEIAMTVGRSRSYVANIVRLLQLPEFLQQELETSMLTVGQARPLLALDGEHLQLQALERIKEKDLNARQVEQLVKELQAGKKRLTSSQPQPTAELRQLMQRLKDSLGTPVDIRLKNTKKIQGTIEVSFKSEEELMRLISYIESE